MSTGGQTLCEHGVERLGVQREVVDGISPGLGGVAVILGIDMTGMQRFRCIGNSIVADAADGGPPEPVGYGVCPHACLPLLAVLRQDACPRPVIDIVDGVAAGQLAVDAVPLVVVAVDVRILLHHVVGVGYVFPIILVLGDKVVGEDGRDDVGEVALRVIDVVGLPLTVLADHQPPVQVGVFRAPATVLVDGTGAEVLHGRHGVEVSVLW